jgi:hypothetical protein
MDSILPTGTAVGTVDRFQSHRLDLTWDEMAAGQQESHL